jgi:RNA polymerase sigma factor (sigma-70 family)
MCEQTDAELVAAAQAGDKNAFDQLVRRYQIMSVGVAMRMVADEEVACDLAQEAMLQAYLSLDNLRDAERFRNWLYGTVLNVCRSYLRARRMSLSLEAVGGLRADVATLANNEPALDEVFHQRELHALLREQIDTLSAKNRAAMLLFYYGELSLNEIAQMLDISVTAVKSRLYKSRKQLKSQLALLLPEERVPISERERKPAMIKITAMHAVKTAATENYILMLLDQPGRRVLPIWIGSQEGQQILLYLRQFSTGRPMTFQFMTRLLATSNVVLQEVRIDALKDDTFYATVSAHNGDGIHEIDARPSDAIALALHTGSSVYVTDEVMASAGRDLPQAFDQEAWQQISLSDEELEKVYGIIQPQPLDIEEERSRFTKQAETCWQRAQGEAKRLNHNYVGTEHLLLGLVYDSESLAAKVLREMDIEAEQVVEAVERFLGRGLQPYSGEPVISRRLGQVVQLAEEERRVLNHRFIGTEHLLLGVVREGKGAASTILRSLDVNLNRVQNQIIDHITRT